MIRSQAPRRALAAHLLLASVTLVGCSFPTSEFTLDAGGARVDAPALDAPALDVPSTDASVADVTDVTDASVVDVTDASVVDVTDASVVDVTDASVVDAPTCPTGQTYCVDGCVDPNTSAAHCGGCGNACAAANAVGVCAAGACSFTCNPGYADCNGVAVDGCEASLASATTCGSCMTRCNGTNGTPACTAGACTIACNLGYGDCDGNAANGCEANLRTDAARCGACGSACANTNGVPTCAAGACGITCSAGYGNCDGNAANGCEVNLNTDRTHCGACTGSASACTGTQSCVAGACTAVCPAPTTMCTTGCADLATSVTNCGACGRVCTTPNGTPRCAAGACGISSCNAGYGDCDATVAGCETSTSANLLHCGACGVRCAFANAAASCSAGACVLGACNAGYGNCDGNPANGCETNLLTNTANCGACSTRCAPPNAAATCTAGVCGLGACNAGFANCDGSAANGCEINTATDVANCGACNTQCRNFVYGGTTSCTAGACAPVCNVGYANCDGNVTNGCEASTNTNLHCGTCGRTCSLTCGTGGNCRGSAPGGYTPQRYLPPGPAFVDACTAGGRMTYLANLDDGSVLVSLPFAMRFWNALLPLGTQVNIASNGWLSLDGVARQDYYGLLPDMGGPNAVVAPFFTDLATSTTGVCVATVGVAPNRRFVVEWYDAVFLSDRSRHVTFEAILGESGSIEFYYGAMATPPAFQNITVGIENQIGVAAAVVCNPANPCNIASSTRIGYAVQ